MGWRVVYQNVEHLSAKRRLFHDSFCIFCSFNFSKCCMTMSSMPSMPSSVKCFNEGNFKICNKHFSNSVLQRYRTTVELRMKSDMPPLLPTSQVIFKIRFFFILSGVFHFPFSCQHDMRNFHFSFLISHRECYNAY